MPEALPPLNEPPLLAHPAENCAPPAWSTLILNNRHAAAKMENNVFNVTFSIVLTNKYKSRLAEIILMHKFPKQYIILQFVKVLCFNSIHKYILQNMVIKDCFLPVKEISNYGSNYCLFLSAHLYYEPFSNFKRNLQQSWKVRLSPTLLIHCNRRWRYPNGLRKVSLQ